MLSSPGMLPGCVRRAGRTAIVRRTPRFAQGVSLRRTSGFTILTLAAFILSLVATTSLARADVPGGPPFAWDLEQVDTAGDTGLYTSIALDSHGTPYIAYVDDANGTVRVAHRTGAGWVSEQVDGPGVFIGSTNLVIGVNDTLQMSYCDQSTRSVKYATRGPTGWTVTIVDVAYTEGYTRLALDSLDRPVLVYSWNNGWLRYASWNGTSWFRETVDSVAIISRYGDIALDPEDGPHVSYYADGVLRYATKAGNVWTREVVDYTPFAGWYSRIRLDSRGVPHIAYYDSSNGTLRYATQVGGIWTHLVVDGKGDPGWDISFVFDQEDEAQIAYYARIDGSLRFAVSTPGGWVTQTVDSPGVVGWYTGLAADEANLPHISYYDWTHGDLKYAEARIALQVRTAGVSSRTTSSATLMGELVSLGNHSAAEVSFSFRAEGAATWSVLSLGLRNITGPFFYSVTNLTEGGRYEFRAEARSGVETDFGEVMLFTLPSSAAPSTLPLMLAVALGGAGAISAAFILWRRRRKRDGPR